MIPKDPARGAGNGARTFTDDPWTVTGGPSFRAGPAVLDHPAPERGSFDPVQIASVDVAEPIPPLVSGTSAAGTRYPRCRLLVLIHGVPVGVVWVELGADPVAPLRLAAIIDARLGADITRHLEQDGFHTGVDGFAVEPRTLVHGIGGECSSAPVLDERAEPASVVLATRGRPDSLPLAIDALLAGDHPNFEVVVVDNSPQDGRTAQLIRERYADPRVRLVPEPRPGLSYARNRGMGAAQGDIIAFTDDDVVVHPAWLRRVAAEFADPAVTCVTGLVEPMQLDTQAQWWFECGAGFGRGMHRTSYRLDAPPEHAPLFPYQLGSYGTGASMALRRSGLPSGWAFDEALGAGSLTQGGEDIDLFLDVLTHGGALVYQPAALSLHRHRYDDAGLRTQMWGYGRGLTALLTKRLLRRRAERGLLLSRIVAGVRHAFGQSFRANPDVEQPIAAGYPRSLLLREVLGMTQGPLRYLRASRRVRRAALAGITPEGDR
jgi:glycosyltransferase involved in cell wall biosynthesis